jgi:hypothetical protein
MPLARIEHVHGRNYYPTCLICLGYHHEFSFPATAGFHHLFVSGDRRPTPTDRLSLEQARAVSGRGAIRPVDLGTGENRRHLHFVKHGSGFRQAVDRERLACFGHRVIAAPLDGWIVESRLDGRLHPSLISW